MKQNIIKQITLVGLLFTGLMSTSCDAFLDRSPLDQVTPEVYLNNEDHLAAYSINQYDFSSFGGQGVGTLSDDRHTDNMAIGSPSLNRWLPGNLKVPNKADEYSFSRIRRCNYFFEQVLPKYERNEIQGSEANIKHYIGEMYFLRAWNYYGMLKRYGDFPIVKEVLIDNYDQLVDMSKRAPRNVVARFIIEDLEKAAEYMMPEFKAKNRLSSAVAKLVKSRVALFEASWLTYHKGTPFVPGATGWPGAAMSYNADFSINIDAEIDFFLTKAMEASKDVADAVALAVNTGVLNPTVTGLTGWNPYWDLFSAIDMAPMGEVLMWRRYSTDQQINHRVASFIKAGSDYGLTRGQVEAFTMANGLPWYAASSGYKGDETLEKVKEDRDGRLQLFLGSPANPAFLGGGYDEPFRMPNIISSVASEKDVTGYYLRKTYNYAEQPIGQGAVNTYGSITFRGVEAYLNYIEASYMKNKSIDATAGAYWRKIRERAKVATDYNITIGATDMSKEALGDWGTHSAGVMVDPTLYNIRRERRNELMGEGARWDDLRRWRALDQVTNYQIEGFNLWDQNFSDAEYMNENGTETLLISKEDDPLAANVSSKSNGVYLRPYQIVQTNNQLYTGYTWAKANYLTPIPAYEIMLTAESEGGKVDLGTSPLYQNPYWPVTAGGSATE